VCCACGIDNPIGLKLKFYTDDEGRGIAHFPAPVGHRTGRPNPGTRATRGFCTGVVSARCWTSQLGILHSLAFWLPDWV
jgi:hypothetical protein